MIQLAREPYLALDFSREASKILLGGLSPRYIRRFVQFFRGVLLENFR